MADINMLLRLAQQMGVGQNELSGLKNMGSLFNQYQNKSEEEILRELMGMKDSLTKDRAAFNRQLQLIKTMRPMIPSDQREKFDKIIGIIEKW